MGNSPKPTASWKLFILGCSFFFTFPSIQRYILVSLYLMLTIQLIISHVWSYQSRRSHPSHAISHVISWVDFKFTIKMHTVAIGHVQTSYLPEPILMTFCKLYLSMYNEHIRPFSVSYLFYLSTFSVYSTVKHIIFVGKEKILHCGFRFSYARDNG